MKYNRKSVELRNGEIIVLRSPTGEDASDMQKFLYQISGETDYMVRYPEEVGTDAAALEQEQKLLWRYLEDTRGLMISAFYQDRLVANVSLGCVNDKIKLRHRGSMGIAILKEVWGMGIGTLLMNEILTMAPVIGLEQVELGVVAGNERALNLYRKMGFAECGRVPRAFRYKDGSYQDEICMYRNV